MRKRSGWRAAERTYKHLTGELASRARSEREAEQRAALALCIRELEQIHTLAYPDCTGGCPAHEALGAARKAVRP